MTGREKVIHVWATLTVKLQETIIIIIFNNNNNNNNNDNDDDNVNTLKYRSNECVNDTWQIVLKP